MIKKRHCWLAFISFGILGLYSIYLPAEEMVFSRYAPCSANRDECAIRILARGEIGDNSAEQLMRELGPYDKGLLYPTICFDSVGGSIVGALKLGRVIRRYRLATCVSEQYVRQVQNLAEEEVFVLQPICASACVFAFAAGRLKLLTGDVRIGVHQFYGKEGDIGGSAAQVAVAAIAKYLDEVGVNRRLLDISSIVPPAKIRFLTADELNDLGLNSAKPAKAKWILEGTPAGQVILTAVQPQPDSWVILVVQLWKNKGRYFMSAGGIMTEFDVDNLRVQIPNIEAPELSIILDGKLLAQYVPGKWAPMSNVPLLSLSVPLTDADILAISSGKTLGVNFGLSNSQSYLDPSGTVGLDGIAPQLRGLQQLK